MFENVTKLLNSCPCGRKHSLLTDECVVADDAALHMKDYIAKRGFKNPVILCDDNTRKFTGDLADITTTIFSVPGNAHATEVYSAQAIDFVKASGADVLIAVGSGSLHDITRYAAFETKVPFISYPTAASVDGFVSGVAAMTWYGQKLTFESAPPIAVFAVPDVFCTAPTRLTASGVGDVIGKYTSLFDWKAAEILTGEYRCPGICGLEYEAIDAVCDAIKARSPETEREYTIKVMEALLLSGLAMQLTGNSRPASGAEHHMSHLWEMCCINEDSDALHGEKVGVGLLYVLREYHRYLKNDIDADKIAAIDVAKVFDRAHIEAAYGTLTDVTLKENLPKGKSSLEDIKVTADTVPAILEAAKSLPTAEEAEALLKAAGAPVSNEEINLPYDEAFIEKTLTYAPYVRNRLTLLKVIQASKL
ncbi:MAG: sn-glycerol-1-phosphate dehydrogenase [Ruminococcaceae bacterium]|nr:sn-glycerol-1-phosphate dehydrogenase [Oscillospiraceae bacterium]